jgi:hypothetical protein
VKHSMSLLLSLSLLFSFVACKDSSQADKDINIKKPSADATLKDPGCSSLSQTTCSDNKSCEMNGTDCVATTAFCKQSTKSATCSSLSSCNWSSANSICEPAPGASRNSGGSTSGTGSADGANCSMHTTQADCSAAVNCNWNATSRVCLSSLVNECTPLSDQTSCSGKAGCIWVGSTCQSASTSQCALLDQTQCDQLAGICKWNGTSCADATGGSSPSTGPCETLTAINCVMNSSRCKLTFPSFKCAAKI